MGLINTAQTGLALAFDTSLSDVVKDFTLTRSVNGDYDAISGKYAQTKKNYNSRGVFEDYGTEEIRKNVEIKTGDVKLIILANEIGILPIVDDVISNYTVINVVNVFDITYEVQLRGI